MTHKKIAEISNEIYIPLHVGKEDIGYIGDNSGDHILDKNGGPAGRSFQTQDLHSHLL